MDKHQYSLKAVTLAVICVIVLILVVFLVRNTAARSEFLMCMLDHSAPSLVSSESIARNLERETGSLVYSSYGILARRCSNIAIETALKDLRDPDPYVWMNAASYLGTFKRKESVPYLIKALRHTAWRSDQERVEMLQRITGQNIGNEFNKWQEWYLSTPDPIKLDWERNLGFRPRIKKSSQQDTTADADKPRH